jgi:hypothetical protein
VCRRTPQVAAVTSLIGPERKRAADDGVFGDRSKVAAIEAVPDVPVHEKDFARAKRPTALPDRQLATNRRALIPHPIAAKTAPSASATVAPFAETGTECRKRCSEAPAVSANPLKRSRHGTSLERVFQTGAHSRC